MLNRMASFPICGEINLLDENENRVLLDDLLTKIIQNFPIIEWPQLELVSKQFQRCIQNAYRTMKTLDLKAIFLPEFGKDLKKGNKKAFSEIFTKLIKRCPLLQTISGFDCLLEEISSDQLDLLSELTKLNNVDFKSVTVDINDLSRFLKKFPLLKSLELYCYDIKPDGEKNDADFDFVANFSGLVQLRISNLAKCSGSFLSLVNAENLNVLNFSGSNFRGIYVVALLNRCVNLESLFLYDPTTCFRENIVGLELQVLQCLPKLTKLRKFDLQIYRECRTMRPLDEIKYTSDDLLGILKKCKNLRVLRIESTAVEIVTDNFLHGLISECPLLEDLDFKLKHCNNEEMVSKLTYLEHLTRLILRKNKNNSLLLKGLCSKLDKLNNLSRLMLVNVEEEELVLLKNLKSLTHFICYGVITETVVRIWIECGFLKKLTYLNARFADDGIAKSVFENAPNLKMLQIRGDIDDETLLSIAECCEYLHWLDLQRCSGITANGLLKLLSSCPTLRFLKVDDEFYNALSSNVVFQPFKSVVCCRAFTIEDSIGLNYRAAHMHLQEVHEYFGV